jgi:hypothetical protein
LSDHKHDIFIRREDTKVCIKCGKVLGFEESSFQENDDRDKGIRDYFAVSAMHALLQTGIHFDCKDDDTRSYEVREDEAFALSTKTVVRQAYKIADAMLEDRK